MDDPFDGGPELSDFLEVLLGYQGGTSRRHPILRIDEILPRVCRDLVRSVPNGTHCPECVDHP